MSTYEPEIPDESEQLDDQQFQPEGSLEDRGVADALDEGYNPPEGYSAATRIGDHETLDQRLAEEIPDPVDPEPRPIDPNSSDVDEIDPLDDVLDDGEVGDLRAGRLVDPNEGIGADVDSELYGEDVGIDGAAASAEEAAVHVVDEG